jgi:N-acetylneuraminate synthase
MVAKLSIGNRDIGPAQSCFIIAEAGVNHNGDIRKAKKLIAVAAASHADAVKFQTFSAEKIAIRNAPKADYQEKNTPVHETQFQMLKKLELSEEQFEELSEYARKKKILFLSTPFDGESVEILERIGIPAFKVSSGELTNFPLLKIIASKGKPVIISTGMATMDEVRAAVDFLRENGVCDLALLHCTSNYPAAVEDVNLRAMTTLADAFDVPVGYSDHTQGILIPLLAVAHGACIIEKHFTLDKNLPGPDHQASLEPDEFKEMVEKIRMVEMAIGNGEKKPTKSEEGMRRIARKSIVSVKRIQKGAKITAEMLDCRRPGSGLSPQHLPEIIGKNARQTIPAETLITRDMIE